MVRSAQWHGQALVDGDRSRRGDTKRGYDALAAGKVTGTNREVEAVVAVSFAARTAASSASMAVLHGVL